MKKVFRGLPSPEERLDCAVAIGNFDGVHRGHQALLHEVVEAAHARLLCPAVLTFEPHPREFFNPEDAPRRISSLHDKVEAIEACGIQRVYILRFNEHLASLSPCDFVKEILVDGLHARWVTVGENFRFGDKRASDIKLLEQLGKEFHFEVHPMPMLYHTHAPISSSRIRHALAEGDIPTANYMLGRPYMISGRVLHGKQLGHTLGFPTINQRILPPHSKAKPAIEGVYAVKAHGIGPRPIEGVACVGRRPTVDDHGEYLLETHLFNFHGDLYDQDVKVEFFSKIRDEKKFGSLEELRAAIADDQLKAKQILGLRI